MALTARRAVEVWAGDGHPLGGGCVVADRLILTVKRAAEGLVEVRAADGDGVWRARPVWVGRDVDAALLAVDPGERDPSPLPPARFARPTARSSVTAVGVAAARGGTGLRGVIRTATAPPQDRYQLMLDPVDRPGDRPPPRAGAAVVSTATGGEHVLGIVVEGPEGFEDKQLTVEPVWRMAGDPAFGETFRRFAGRPLVLDSVELSRLLLPYERDLPDSPVAPLLAEAEGTEFWGREEELADLRQWCEGDGFAARLLYAPGGEGKTRLARQLLAEMAGRDWTGGFLDPNAEPGDLARHVLEETAHPALYIVDYAETLRTAKLPRLAATLGPISGVPIRLLLLARSAQGLEKRLSRAEWLRDISTTRLRPLYPETGVRAGRYRQVVRELAARLSAQRAYGERTWEHAAAAVPVPDLSDPAFGNVLNLHMAAHAALLRHGPLPVDDGPLERQLLAHEERAWSRRAERLDLALPEGAVRQAVVLSSLFNATDEAEAVRLLDAAPLLAGQSPATKRVLLRLLSELHPPAFEGLLTSVRPERLADHLVAGAISRGGNTWLDPIIEVTSPGQRRRLLIALARAAESHGINTAVGSILLRNPVLRQTAIEIHRLVTPTRAFAGVLGEQPPPPAATLAPTPAPRPSDEPEELDPYPEQLEADPGDPEFEAPENSMAGEWLYHYRPVESATWLHGTCSVDYAVAEHRWRTNVRLDDGSDSFLHCDVTSVAGEGGPLGIVGGYGWHDHEHQPIQVHVILSRTETTDDQLDDLWKFFDGLPPPR